METQFYTYKYPHPAVTADCVVFGFDGKKTNILLIQRSDDPYKGCWAFPGGFMNIDEAAEQAAVRELLEETGLNLSHVRQIGAFSKVDRDPRERVITVAFYTITQIVEVQGLDDAAKAQWFPLDELPPLAFDHDLVLRKALEQLKKDYLFDSKSFDLFDKRLLSPIMESLDLFL